MQPDLIAVPLSTVRALGFIGIRGMTSIQCGKDAQKSETHRDGRWSAFYLDRNSVYRSLCEEGTYVKTVAATAHPFFI